MLFQLLGLLADWEGASNQLVAYSELVGRQSPLPIIFNQVIQAEVRRNFQRFRELTPEQRERMRERWRSLTPEQRQRLIDQRRDRHEKGTGHQAP